MLAPRRLYEKLRYMSRLDYMWAHMEGAEVTDCVRDTMRSWSAARSWRAERDGEER